MDGRDQGQDDGRSMVEFKNRSDPCAQESHFPYKTKVTNIFLLIWKIEKGLYVCTLSGLEEWGLLFNLKGICSFNQIMNLG